MTGGNPEVRFDKRLTLLTFTFDIQPLDQWSNGLMVQWTHGPNFNAMLCSNLQIEWDWDGIYYECWYWIFSCPGSSIPDLGHWVSATLELLAALAALYLTLVTDWMPL